ncbi:Ribosomal RNA small subunit methyltransferase D [Tepidimonas alkaliphilus]|uniref:Ribosomal RNA small subunit methyltransferase D n=1 Tax=Tepidimonas alkaliphilus TaxID=2588942 RepID=A0A554W5V5_9BURK|nr:16S rRNA (guanine(966)-N(2))-methyltransferase RsmD [Tepidimonas alkaliphilus]TSE18967.1 Ribosomal RNA small subunit methyltransferase D [Tepidimonas alkaliphilus]
MSAPVRRGAPPGEVRIVGGRWRRSKLPVPPLPGLRPTPDRVRETLFNWLGQHLHGWRCVDAFAGTGALGLEAASRGAVEVVLVERQPQLLRALHEHVQRLQGASDVVRVVGGEALGVLAGLPAARWHLVLLDPPFDGGAALFEAALRQARRLVAADGLAYLEAPQPWDEARLASLGWAVQRHLRAGQVHAHLLRPLDNLQP